MKKFYLKQLLAAMMLLCSAAVSAQSTPTYFSCEDGLPGNDETGQYIWESPVITADGGFNGVRITVFASTVMKLEEDLKVIYANPEFHGFPMLSLAELEIYDGEGNKIEYTADDITKNSFELSEGSMEALYDGDATTFYHSTWNTGLVPNDYVYLDIAFPHNVDAVKIKFTGRRCANTYTNPLTPTILGVTKSGEYCKHPEYTSGTCGENAVWSYSNNTLTISGTGEVASNLNFAYYLGKKAYIKQVVIEEGITSLAYAAFLRCSAQMIVLPKSITSINEGAFHDCYVIDKIVNFSSLTSDDIRKAIKGFRLIMNAQNAIIENDFVWIEIEGTNVLRTYIGDDINVVLPESYNGESYSIGDYAFYDCTGLTSITIPESVTSIGDEAFNGCTGLTSITIPNSITSIGDYAFSDCSSLESITIPESITSIGSGAFFGCTGLTSITIPESVTSIGSGAFYGCTGLTSITIPNSITSIGDYAFYNCAGLTSITIPESITSIGDYAFYDCAGLTSITIPESVTSIGSSAFYGCTGLKEVINYSNQTFTKGATSYGYVAYYADRVVNIPNGSIEGDFTFGVIDGVNTLTGYLGTDSAITLPDSYKGEDYVIGSYAFYGCTGLTNVTIPASITHTIDATTFEGCNNLKEVSLGSLANWCGMEYESIKQAKSLERLYLNGNEITKLEIPAGVQRIGLGAFYSCKNITEVYFPESLDEIGGGAIYNSDNITAVYSESATPPVMEFTTVQTGIKLNKLYTFSNTVFKSATLYVPIGAKSAYEEAKGWDSFINIVEMDFTAIDDIEADGTADGDAIYDLNGRRVTNPTKGIYIQNGKKVIY